ncbi:MAG TPA: hemerythrin family protein [Lachnospiraceae bacterium]|nr:hemerythrin family protein [Lachnospiraceae bacterium]
MFEMKDEYKIGVPFIDEQHAKLFEIAERAYQLLSNEYIPDKYDGIVTILQELTDYTRMHFADEEAYMESIGYKKMFSQKIDHNEFVHRLEEIDLQKVDDNQEESILNILNYLNDWLVHHILEKDKQIVEA